MVGYGSVVGRGLVGYGSAFGRVWFRGWSGLVGSGRVWSGTGPRLVGSGPGLAVRLVQLVQMNNGGSTHLARSGGPGAAYAYEK